MATKPIIVDRVRCTKCRETKLLEEYPEDSSWKCGRNLFKCSYCLATPQRKRRERAAQLKVKRQIKREYEARYRHEHPEIIAAIKAKSARKRRAQKKSSVRVVTLTLEDLVKRQKGKCALCREPFTADAPPTLDHILPLSRGGLHDDANFQALHRSCNSRKGAG